MQDELKMQAELKKIIANSDAAHTIEELSDEALEAVAGGTFQCLKKTTENKFSCSQNSRSFNGNGLV